MGLIDDIRRAARTYPTGYNALARDSGLDAGQVWGFAKGRRGLSCESLDALCKTLNLCIVEKRKVKRGKP